MIAERFKITDPENYALCTYIGGKGDNYLMNNSYYDTLLL